MNAKEAADKAIANVKELYEKAMDCRLEELAKDDAIWKVTISFLVEEIPTRSGSRLNNLQKSFPNEYKYLTVRLYKLLTVSDETGELIAMNSVKA
ncbi:MAG: hypothetical protein QTN59_03270 [Candidatus Electrothrix communis]|nr:MAG: hypothetical protein QTN59_03270 [Candidatus Electrothrix communis]